MSEREIVMAFPAGNFVENTECGNVLEGAILGYRDELKKDPNWRQGVTYVQLWNEIDQILVYQRTKMGGEGRLHGNLSIGFGGHVNEIDVTSKEMWDRFFTENPDATWPQPVDLTRAVMAMSMSAIRELREELGIDIGYENLRRNFDDVLDAPILDNDSEVGRIHVGSAAYVKVDSASEFNPSPDCSIKGWVDVTRLITDREAVEAEFGAKFEPWSVEVLKRIRIVRERNAARPEPIETAESAE